MSLDPYALCPAGTGKKLKFCCSDLLGELEKIDRMLAGQQRLAALEHIERLEAKYPDRACLLTTKATLQAELGQADAARQTTERVLATHPSNPVALAEKSLLEAAEHGAAAGVPFLQEALEQSSEVMPAAIYSAIGSLAQLLLADGYFVAGRAHVELQQTLAADQDHRPAAMLMQIRRSPTFPLLLKEGPYPQLCPEGAAYQKAFDQALQWQVNGEWRRAAAAFEQLCKTAPQEPSVWWNLAVARACLTEQDAAAAALRRMTALDLPWEKAVEAEALAQMLDRGAAEDLVDVVDITYAVADVEKLIERMVSDKRVQTAPVEAHATDEGEPPPRSAFIVLDRPVAASAADLTLDAASQLIGVAYLFGKQTDREARLELLVRRTPQEAQAVAAVQQIAGDALGPRQQETVRDQMSALADALTFNYRLPDDATMPQMRRLTAEHRRRVLLDQWPDMPQPLLGGATPRAAAAEAAQRLKVAAIVLRLDLSSQGWRSDFNFDELRQRLGLPLPKTIDPWQTKPELLSLVELARVDIAKLDDEQVAGLFIRAYSVGYTSAARKLGYELAERSNLPPQVDRAAIYGSLASLTDDPAVSIELLHKAQAEAVAKNQSPSRWLLEELAFQLDNGDSDRTQQLLNELTTKYAHEPNVRQTLLQLMQAVGAVDAYGRPVARAEQPLAAAAAPEAGKLWTPEAAAAPAAAAGGSKLWLPGME